MVEDGIEYARHIVSCKIISCELEYLSCKRFLEDLEKQNTPELPYIFDTTRGQRVLDFIQKHCNHVKGILANQPIQLLPFQKYDLINIFGWVDVKGARRFTRAFIEEARGNAKSCIMSTIALYGMISDVHYPPFEPEKAEYEMNPNVVCAAYDKLQARIVHKDACDMATYSPEIKKRLLVKRTYVEHKTRGGSMEALSNDVRNKDGKSVTIAIADEIHVWRTSDVMDIILSGFGKRFQNLFCAITTAGQDAENSVGKKEHDICEKILRREIADNSYFAVIRKLDDGDDPHDEALWCKANPMIRYDTDYAVKLKQAIKQNHDIGFGSNDPSKIREFLIKRCCLWQTDSEAKYMSGCMDKYKALAVNRKEFLQIVKDREVWAGVDLSKCRDLTAVGYVFRLDDGRYAVSAHGFMPTERATEHEHSDRVPYKAWAKDGWVELTPGAVTRLDYVERYIESKDHRGNLKEICYDPYSAWEFASNMESRGHVCVEVRQGVQSLSEATKKFRDLVLEGKIVHDGNPLLTWCLSNALEVVDNNGNIKLSKKHKDDSQRIDAIAAIINAMTRAYVPDKVSIYESRGMRTI